MRGWKTRLRRALSSGIAILMVAMLVPVSVGTAAPSEYYVDAGTGSDTTGDGSQGNPWQSISKAMIEATAGDTVWVEPGTYDTTVELLFPIAVRSGVAIRSTAGYGSTYVDAEGTDAVFVIGDATAGTILEGLTVTGGGTVNGGGIKIMRYDTGPIPMGWPKISDCFVTENARPGERGGGIQVFGAVDATCAPLIEDTIIADNSANYGGGIACREQTILEMRNCTVRSNTSVYSGGGVYLVDSFDATMLGCQLALNESTSDGGGALSTAADGLDCELTIRGCDVLDNDADYGGGGIYVDNATVEMEATTFTGNASPGDGGAIYFNGSHAYVTDCQIADNHSGDDGGAVALNSMALTTLTQCSIAGNTGTDWNGIYNNGTVLDVYNSIIGGHGDQDISGSGATVAYSCIEDNGISGTGVTHDDPLMFDAASGDMRLRIGSPCIDTAGALESDSDDIDGDPRPVDGDGDGTALPDMGCWEHPALEVDRYAGVDRYDTACQMAEEAFGSATVAVVASGENFPDALSAAGLAGAYSAPLLLVKRTSVPTVVQDTLETLGVQDVVIVGGAAAVSGDVYDWFQNTGGYNVSRVFGNTRYETSAEVALEIAGLVGPQGIALFARGDAFPDALAAAPIAYHSTLPILLVKPTSAPAEIISAMDTLDIDEGYVLGGTAAVGTSAKQALDDEITDNGGSASERWAGDDRYETATIVAENGTTYGFTSAHYVGIATGTNFPDALAGGVTAGENGGVLVLTKPTSLPTATHDFLAGYGDAVVDAQIYGGTGAVTDSVKSAIFDALGW